MTHKTRAQVETELRDRLERASLSVARVYEDWNALENRLKSAYQKRADARTALTQHLKEGGS